MAGFPHRPTFFTILNCVDGRSQPCRALHVWLPKVHGGGSGPRYFGRHIARFDGTNHLTQLHACPMSGSYKPGPACMPGVSMQTHASGWKQSRYLADEWPMQRLLLLRCLASWLPCVVHAGRTFRDSLLIHFYGPESRLSTSDDTFPIRSANRIHNRDGLFGNTSFEDAIICVPSWWASACDLCASN